MTLVSGFVLWSDSLICFVLEQAKSGTDVWMTISLMNWKSRYLLLETMIAWLHKAFSGKIPLLENAGGILDFFSPLKICISSSCSSIESKSSFFNLGIGWRMNTLEWRVLVKTGT